MSNPIVKILRFLLFFPLCFVVFWFIDWGLIKLLSWVMGWNWFVILLVGFFIGGTIVAIFTSLAGMLVTFVTYISPVKWLGSTVMALFALANGVYLIYKMWSFIAFLGHPEGSIFAAIVFTIIAVSLTFSLTVTAISVLSEEA